MVVRNPECRSARTDLQPEPRCGDRPPGRRAAIVGFERNACSLDGFQLYFIPKAERIGFSLLTRSRVAGRTGLLPAPPRATASWPESGPIARDLVVVLDTSASMVSAKLRQGKAAVTRTLGSLGSDDRFGMIAFATMPDVVPARTRRARHPAMSDGPAPGSQISSADGGTDISGASRRPSSSGREEHRGGSSGRRA